MAPWGRLLVKCVPMREQRTAKLTLNSEFDILKLLPLFTVSSHIGTKMIKSGNFQYFSIKSHVVDVYLNRLADAILIHIHDI